MYIKKICMGKGIVTAITSIALAGISFFFIGFLVAHASYLPGQTLNPNCLPTDPTCYVQFPTSTTPASTSTLGYIQLSGDIGGSATSVTVTGLQGYSIATTTPTSSQVLEWNGSQWTPSNVSSSSTLPSGVTSNGNNGLNVSGSVVAGTTVLSDGSGFHSYLGVNEFGDSTCYGTGATSLAYGWCNLVGSAIGNSTNYGHGGDQAGDTAYLVYANLNPTATGNLATILEDGINEAAECGASVGCLSNFSHIMQSSIAWATIPNQAKTLFGALPPSVSTTGTWTVDSTLRPSLGLSTITNGSTITFTTFYPSTSLYLTWLATNSDTAVGALNCDAGALTDTLNASGFNGQSVSTVNGKTTVPFTNIYTGLANIVHTCTVTVASSSAGNPFSLEWTASGQAVGQTDFGAPNVNPPMVYVSGVINEQNGNIASTTSLYDTAVKTAVSSVASSGWLAYFVDARDAVNSTTDMSSSSVTLANGCVLPASTSPGNHPNGGLVTCLGATSVMGGHANWAAAFLAAMKPRQVSASTRYTTPAWLQNLGTGVDGANLSASGGLAGDKFYTNFTVPYGNTVTVSPGSGGLTIHATGACIIAGSITSSGSTAATAYGGASGGGSGGGAAAGSGGKASTPAFSGSSIAITTGGTAGALSGGNGGNGSSPSVPFQRMVTDAGGGSDGMYLTGGSGSQGGSSGGALGTGGGGITLICQSITGTDGTHTGIIDVSGNYGTPAVASSTGDGSGGGGGVVILSSSAPVSTWPSIYAAGGPGALSTVPEALGTSGTCTSPPKATLGVSGGALSGTCTVVQAGAGCGTGANVTFNILGGGGTVGTAVVNPTWNSGALASCTVSPGTSSGYTATTNATSGAGGDGGAGWNSLFSGWQFN